MGQKKILIKLFILSIIFFSLGLPVGFAVAADTPDIKIDIGGFNKTGFSAPNVGECGPGGGVNCLNISWISQYVSALFNYGIAIAVALAIVMIMIGGLVWLMSGGRQEQIGKAKEFIIGALSGLLLVLFSVVILMSINPNMIQLKPLSVTTALEVYDPYGAGCCKVRVEGFNRVMTTCAPVNRASDCRSIEYGGLTRTAEYIQNPLYCDGVAGCEEQDTNSCYPEGTFVGSTSNCVKCCAFGQGMICDGYGPRSQKCYSVCERSCGGGVFNLCDKEECEGIHPGCEFTPGVVGRNTSGYCRLSDSYIRSLGQEPRQK